jgi:hypothetical protein
MLVIKRHITRARMPDGNLSLSGKRMPPRETPTQRLSDRRMSTSAQSYQCVLPAGRGLTFTL